MYPHLKEGNISSERRDNLSSQEFKKLLTNILDKNGGNRV